MLRTSLCFPYNGKGGFEIVFGIQDWKSCDLANVGTHRRTCQRLDPGCQDPLLAECSYETLAVTEILLAMLV